MAIKYCYSSAAGTADGSSWANAYTTMTAAIAGMGASDTLYVADDHSESTAGAVTLTFPGYGAQFICARRVGGSVPPVSADLRTTAVVATTGANTVSLAGAGYVRGITFSAGTAASGANINITPNAIVFDACGFKLNNTSTSSRINMGASGTAGFVKMANPIFTFGSTGQAAAPTDGVYEITGLSLAGSATTSLFLSGSRSFVLTVRDSDLSSLGSGKTIMQINIASPCICNFERCKVGAAVTLAGTPNAPGMYFNFINCDSGATGYLNSRYQYQGTLNTETTVIVTTAAPTGLGASDGVTQFSHKIVTSANSNAPLPFESFPLFEYFSGVTGVAISQTFELMTDNVVLTNADAWVDLEYLGSAASPLGSIASSGIADPLAAGANLTVSATPWTTTGLGTPKPQKIAVNFTPQLKGLYRAVLKVAKPSTTLWLNPPAAKAA